MRIKISPKQIQQTILAPSMQQSIEILLLPIQDLSASIDQELQENPLLEVDEEKTALNQQRLEDMLRQNIRQLSEESPVPSNFSDDIESPYERQFSRSTPLEEYLLQQLRIELSDPIEISIGEFIIGNINEDGYMEMSSEEIADILHIESLEKIEQVLQTIQNFDPVGIAARDLKECLIIQAHFKYHEHHKMLEVIITDHLDELGKKKYPLLARKLKTSLQEIEHISQMIASLDPKPARKYRPADNNIYIKPDVTITKQSNDEFKIVVNRDNIPTLRINRFYQNLLSQPNRSKEERAFVEKKLTNAILFIKSIEQRQQTIKDIAQCILNLQKDFFHHGPLFLKPMILKDVAQKVERNESTVCRTVNNKYIDTPLGLYPMKYFFSEGINNNTSDALSSRSIKEELKDMIKDENKARPLSDQALQKYFEDKGLKMARRTISKYRQGMKILPSHLRKVEV